MAEQEFDIVVIGGGPGGYLAAIRASQLGLHTALVEKESLGGVCLNWGCIPTKALLRNAEVLRLIRHSKDYGITVGEVAWDYESAYKRSRQVSNRLVRGVGFLMKKNRIAVFDGTASFLDGKQQEAKWFNGYKEFTSIVLMASLDLVSCSPASLYPPLTLQSPLP